MHAMENGQRAGEPRAAMRVISVVSVVVLLLVLVALAWAAQGTGGNDSDPFAGGIDDDRYQAVILENDQVLFGKVAHDDGDFYRLRNAYVLRTEEDAKTPTVVSFSSQYHQPQDTLLVDREHVVMIQNLRNDSPVAQAIEDAEDSR